jgi:hypothetical protein
MALVTFRSDRRSIPELNEEICHALDYPFVARSSDTYCALDRAFESLMANSSQPSACCIYPLGQHV